MEYAVDMLPTPLTLDSLNSPVALNKSLGIVVRGLEVNRDSEALWSLYIELLGHHVGTATGLREVFEEALKFLPNSFEIWWRFYLYEPVHKEKENILRKIIVSFSSSSQSRDIVSRSITSATLHLSKLFCDYSLDELSVSWLLKFLTSSNWDWVPNMTEAESIKEIWGSRVPPKDSMAHGFLTEQDLNTCWVTVFHLIYSGTFPETLFYDYPFDFIAVPCYFLIKWDALEENAVTSVTISELSEIWETVLYELLKDLEGNRRSLFFVLLRGYAEFLRDAAKNVGQAQRLVKIFFEKTVFSEELSLLYFALFQEPISQVAPISAECWGMKAKHTLRNGDLVGAAHDLVQGVYSCFKDIVKVEPFESLDDASQEIDDAIDHVKSLLRLQTDLSFTLKLEPKLDIAGYRENPCIWMILVLMEVWKVTAIGIQTDVRQILSWAIDAVSGQGEQRLLWLEMMKWEVSSGLRHSGGIGSKKILGTLEEAIDAVKERSGGLFKAEDAFPRCSQRNSRMRRSSDLQPLIQAALKGLAKEQKADLLEVLLQSRPETIVFSPALVKLFFDVKAWKQARAFILACLVANPKSIHRWDLLLTLEDLGGALGSKDSIPGLLAIAGFFLDKDDVEMLRGRYSVNQKFFVCLSDRLL
ncbi:hypothetical protein BC829DRAFT_385504 [Chytridium lagenaria]|nr:hypothetical protein BC829DRAFT_385504 [Chytridium lagenaria]